MQLTLVVYLCVGFDPGNKVGKAQSRTWEWNITDMVSSLTSFDNLWLKKFN